jgi:hypothetical protein
MPHIITTRAYATSAANPREPAPRHRRAVVEGDMQYTVDELIEEHGGSIDEYDDVPVDGGPVGPLPDGAVLDVKRVTWSELAAAVDQPWPQADRPAVFGRIIDAYNRAESERSDSDAQQAWWASMTPEQREAYEDRIARERAERETYGRVLTDAERARIA